MEWLFSYLHFWMEALTFAVAGRTALNQEENNNFQTLVSWSSNLFFRTQPHAHHKRTSTQARRTTGAGTRGNPLKT